MKKIFSLFFIMAITVFAEERFDVEAYNEYLKSHEDMTYQQLLDEYPAGLFQRYAKINPYDAEYFDSIMIKFPLSDYEVKLISDHSFMVSGNRKYNSFQKPLYDIYHADLPVYVSADAILHALHVSFDNILKEKEENELSYKLTEVVNKVRSVITSYKNSGYGEVYDKAVNDLDVYFTIAKSFLSDKEENAVFPGNQNTVKNYLNLADTYKPHKIFLFTDVTDTKYDFSQLKPRGHYTDSRTLERYFKAMMWMGRTDIFIEPPVGVDEGGMPKVYTEDEKARHRILSALIAHAVKKSGAEADLKFIEDYLVILLGRQDNISIWESLEVLNKLNINQPHELSDAGKREQYRDELMKFSSANQLYNSQILYSDPLDTARAKTSSALLAIGQRPILDGFITGNVVYDKIIFEKKAITRMKPSTKDILFALGNDAVIQLLENELLKYKYSRNLAGLRYLIDGYEDDYWKSSFYSGWLKTIKSLNPPKERENMPKFMQTAAWWQKTMTTQLASWIELRHDFLLYAKQPYTTGIPICSFPKSLVEPVPDLFRAIGNMAEYMVANGIDPEFYQIDGEQLYFTRLKEICNDLTDIAEKQLHGEQLSESQNIFLKQMLSKKDSDAGCVQIKYLDGWFMDLYYGLECHTYSNQEDCGELEPDLLVADWHTVPTDEYGIEKGWVMHSGTGKVNLAVIINEDESGKSTAYIGPVYSYYEHVTENYVRLTDEEWSAMFQDAIMPPATNLYMSDSDGNDAGEYEILKTIVVGVDTDIKKAKIQVRNYPNPFSESTVIAFNIPESMYGTNATLSIFDTEGNEVLSLASHDFDSGIYSYRWSGEDNSGRQVPDGIYLARLSIGDRIYTAKISRTRK